MSARAGRAARATTLAILGVGAIVAAVPAFVLRGFTVDDALIPARYAAHIAAGAGYRFNAGGPVTDGVTPLGFPYLLAPFAARGALSALRASKAIGVMAWAIASAVLALAVFRAGRSRLRFGALPIIALSTPMAAWSVAGLETGLALALGAIAVSLVDLERRTAAAVAAGLLAAIRPEALPFALALAVAAGLGQSRRALAGLVAIAAAPFAAVVATRLAIFGRPVPLSVLAKPSDWSQGWRYAVACALLTGPVALVAPWAWGRATGRARSLAVAAAIHFLAVAAAGGDWMPVSRLVVPALPAVVLAFAHLTEGAAAWSSALRLVLALGAEVFQAHAAGFADLRAVTERRTQILEAARPMLEGSRVVAALDIGWLGAATDASIVDLAGVTDPAIATLPGAHTSKTVSARILDARDVDTAILLVRDGEDLRSPWTDTWFARRVELRLAAIPDVGHDFQVIGECDAPHLRYLVVRRSRGAP